LWDIAKPIPTGVFLEMLGLPQHMQPQFLNGRTVFTELKPSRHVLIMAKKSRNIYAKRQKTMLPIRATTS